MFKDKFFLAILNNAESLNSVITIIFLYKVFKYFFISNIHNSPSWERVSGVVPDFEITINPVIAKSNLKFDFEKTKDQYYQKQYIIWLIN